ncbi:hypothetical protein HMPREF3033_01456 [Veillonellaceae bacterium DNF00751]|nr:hypothetical protein HMPREF3033_01456 [Veillonellaceae bacterium DNF00751]
MYATWNDYFKYFLLPVPLEYRKAFFIQFIAYNQVILKNFAIIPILLFQTYDISQIIQNTTF